jgi:hypothetical protein
VPRVAAEGRVWEERREAGERVHGEADGEDEEGVQQSGDDFEERDRGRSHSCPHGGVLETAHEAGEPGVGAVDLSELRGNFSEEDFFCLCICLQLVGGVNSRKAVPLDRAVEE